MLIQRLHQIDQAYGANTHVDRVGILKPNTAPADVALQIMLHDESLLWRFHAEMLILKPKTYIHYVSDDDPLDDFSAPTQAELDAMAAAMDTWFEEKKRGRGCGVYAVKDSKETKVHFLIRHGMQFKREGAVTNGKSSCVAALHTAESNDRSF